MIKITFPDGREQEYEAGVSALDIARSISEGLARNVLSAKVNDEIWEANRPIHQDATVQLLTWNDKEGKASFWHSSAHLMAEALEALYPGIKLGIGPAVEMGFYYDVDPGDRVISTDDFERIEKKMKELASQKNEFVRQEVSKTEAIKHFQEKGDEYKLELLEDLEDGEITLYHQGNFTDLCRGGHIPHTGFIKAAKLIKVGGAYWRGDEKNKQLTRIYGISFPKQKELTEYLEKLELAKERDHRKVGKELELFTFSDLVGSGFPMLLPKGATLRRTLERFVIDEELKRGYQHVSTPHMAHKEMYEKSGHWQLYKDSMYPPMDIGSHEMVLRPMACPHHFMIFGHRPRSYKELPLRIAELASQFRKEQSGELSGLIRVMTFTLADSHIFCLPDQVGDEFAGVLDLIGYCMDKLGISDSITYRASLRDSSKDKYVDNPELWKQTEGFLIGMLDKLGIKYTKEVGHAAFYGPKLDIQMRNILGKEDTIFTVQIDFALPERLDISYIDENSQKQRPVVIHRSSIGSLERTMAFLIEYYGGAFPLWLAPEQVRILTITDRQNDYAKKIQSKLLAFGTRVELDLRNESIGKKIKESRLQKIPYFLILGDKELEEGTVTVWNRDTKKQNSVALDAFVAKVKEEIETYSLELHANKA